MNALHGLDQRDVEQSPEVQAFCNGPHVILTGLEASTLECLLVKAGQQVSRADLFAYTHDNAKVEPTSNVHEVIIGRLRKKLDSAGIPLEINTVRGHGYVLRKKAEGPK